MNSSNRAQPLQPDSRTRHTCRLPALVLSLALMVLAGPAPGADISSATAEAAMARMLQGHGLVPPADSGLSLADYIESTDAEEGTTRAWVSIGPDGNIVPGLEWRTRNPDHCMQRARETLPASQLLRFKLQRIVETNDGKTRYQYFVFAGTMDTGSGIITSQVERGSSIMQDSDAATNPDPQALHALMNEAFDGLAMQPGAVVDACGEIRLQRLSGSQVQEPIVFEAGFPGSNEGNLEFTWDFGDWSESGDTGQRVTHVYAGSGTYPVTVRVQGEDIEPGSRTINVVIGGDLAFHFSSRIVLTAPENTQVVSEFESVVPLSKSADSIFEGRAPLRNVAFSHSMAAMMREGGCTITMREGELDVRATLPPDADRSTGGVEISLSVPYDHSIPVQLAVPGAKLHCPGMQGPYGAMLHLALGGMGATWWTGFVTLHSNVARMDDSFHFTEWDPTNDPSVIARKVYRQSHAAEGPSTISEVTTLEIRRGPPASGSE